MLARQDLAVDLISSRGGRAKYARGVACLEHALADPGAALVDQHGLDVLGPGLENVAGPVQDPGALGVAHAGPSGEGGLRSFDCGTGVGPRRIGDLAKDLAGRRVHDLKPGPICGACPAAVYVDLAFSARHRYCLTNSLENPSNAPKQGGVV